jgi:hypothetical protein
MALRGKAIAASILLISGSAGGAQSDQRGALSVDQERHRPGASEVIVAGRVEHIYGPHLFTIARDGDAPDRALLVFAPTATASPASGSALTARGTLRSCDDAELETVDGCDQLDERVRAGYPSRSVLVARSLITARGRQLTGRVVRSPNAAAIPSLQEERFEIHNDYPITVRPGTLASLVDSLAGGSVRLPYARVVGVFDPRVFLIETQTLLLPIIERNRVLVFIESGSLRVDPAVLVASTVTVSGVARTLLGMQANHDVPWPAVLTRDAVKRLEIKAAVLARSVRTPEGIDLVAPSSSGSPAGRETPEASRPAKER